MIDNELGQQLHDKKTRKFSMTPEELGLLDAWYEQQDAWEASYLLKPMAHNELVGLKNQIAVTMARITVVSQHIRQLTQENEAIRREIMSLRGSA